MAYLIVILIMGFLILIHELGHFLSAKCLKIPIARFSIGFGPKLWAFKKGETEYWISAFPLGGYVLPKVNDNAEFFMIPINKRMIFTLAGPAANMLTCVFLFSILNLVTVGFSFFSIFIDPFIKTLGAIADFAQAIPAIMSQPESLSGIPGIVTEGSKFIQNDLANALRFAIIININLAVLNMLPIVPLDGGKFLLYSLERISPKSLRLHASLNLVGWALMIGLMLYVNARDAINYILAAIQIA